MYADIPRDANFSQTLTQASEVWSMSLDLRKIAGNAVQLENSRPWLSAVQFSGILATALLLAYHSLSDLDLWLHWRVGQDILAGHLPHTNFYSFSAASRPWVDHEWLFQTLIALIGKASLKLGAATEAVEALATGWNTLRILLILGLILILGRPLYRFGSPRGSAATPNFGLAPGLLLSLGLLWPRMTMRPELISYIIFALAVPLAEKCVANSPDQGPNWRNMLNLRTPSSKLIGMTLIWAQFHGFAILIPVIILLALVLYPLQNRGQGSSGAMNLRAGAATLLLSWLALGLTPAGWHGWTYPLTVLGQFTGHGPDLKNTISELVPLAQAPNSLHGTILVYKVCLVWGLIRIILAWPRPNLLRTALFLVAALATWSSQRNLGFMAVAFVLLHRGTWGPGPQWLVELRVRYPLSRLRLWFPLIFTIGALVLWWPAIVTDTFYLHEGVSRRFGSGLTPAQYPVTAAKALGDQPATKVFANLDATAYLVGNTNCKLFIDGRTEAYPARAWVIYDQVKHGDLSPLDTFSVQAVCLALGSGAADNLVHKLMASDRWRISAAGPGGILWSRVSATPATDASGEAILGKAVNRTLALAATMNSPTRKADLYLAASRLANLTGASESVAAALRLGLAARPDHPLLAHNLGNWEMNRKDFESAEKHFAQALATNPRLAGSALNAGVCALRLDKPSVAVGWFLKSLHIDGGNFRAWANLGTARLKSGDRPGAITAFEKAVVLNPTDQRLARRLQELRERS